MPLLRLQPANPAVPRCANAQIRFAHVASLLSTSTNPWGKPAVTPWKRLGTTSHGAEFRTSGTQLYPWPEQEFKFGAMAQRTHQPQLWYFLILTPYAERRAIQGRGREAQKHCDQYIHTIHEELKTASSLKKKNKDIAILKPDTGGLGSIKLVAKLMPAAEICIGIYHWKNDHPGRPLGFHSNIRFTQHYIFNLCQCVFFKFVLCHSCCLECTQCGWI